jgi:hypothetical protein
MKVVALAQAMSVLATIYKDAGDSETVRVITAFAKLLEGHEGKTIGAFSNTLQKAAKIAK